MYKAIVIGVSAGGLKALTTVITALPASFPLPIIIVQHRQLSEDDFLVSYLNNKSALTVMAAQSGLAIKTGHVYIAPAGYHLLVERDQTLSLSIDQRVNYSIPSVDVLFDSAAICYQQHLIGIILTGANNDGSAGLKTINDYNGLSLVQDPDSAEFPAMPLAAISATKVDNILPLDDIAAFLIELMMSK